MYAGYTTMDLVQFVSSLGNSDSGLHLIGSGMGPNVDCSLQVKILTIIRPLP